jgi:hypothetical protein
MPMSMRELDQAYRRTYRRLITGIFILYGTSLLMVLSLLVINPKVSTWVSQAAQSTFVTASAPTAPASLHLAQPATPMQTVKAE